MERRIRKTGCSIGLLAPAMLLSVSGQALAAGTPAGTVIDNVAEVTFDLGGTVTTQLSNTASLTVVERVDVVVTLQSGQILVAANDVDRSLLFTVANTGNGTETMQLVIDSNVPGDDFDPVPAVPAIYFDTDASGDFSAGDIAYTPGTNDPVLAADQTIDVLLVNDIPPTVLNGQIGHSQLTASSMTGTGSPGDSYPGQGDLGTDAVLGNSGGQAVLIGEYLISDVAMNIVKSVAVSDPFGNQDATPGATLTYTITVEVANGGTATNSVFNDVVPAGTTYSPGTIMLNNVLLSDAVDGDEGELDTSSSPTVVIRLGDLIQGDGVQTVVFDVTID